MYPRATISEPSTLNGLTYRMSGLVTSMGMKFGEVVISSMPVTMPVRSVTQSHDGYFQCSLTAFHKSMGKPAESVNSIMIAFTLPALLMGTWLETSAMGKKTEKVASCLDKSFSPHSLHNLSVPVTHTS